MKRVGIVYLIAESPEARGVLEPATETRRKTYCEETSLSMSETYQARASGFSPVFRLKLPQEFEYRGETICEYRGERYSIIREYRDEKSGDSTELTLERIRGNAARPTPADDEPDNGPTGANSEPTEADSEPTGADSGQTEGSEAP